MKKFNEKIQNQFSSMCKTGKLFRVNLTGQEIWDKYLDSFEDMNNPVFRDPNSSTHNCNHCKNFIRRYGNIVSIDDNNKITTMFDVDAPDEFKSVADELTKFISNSEVADIFVETFNELNSLPYESCRKDNSVFRLGVDKNNKRYNKEEAEKYGVVKPEEIRTFDHLHLDLPKQFVDLTGKSSEAIMTEFRDAKNVFKRAMDEISEDTLKLAIDLINQGSLLDGQTHLYKIQQFLPLKQKYDQIPKSEKNNWCWVNSYKLPFAKFKNELIGVFCTELSEGEDLNKACQSWNKRVDPANYMKATAPITKKQIEEAKSFVEENGYEQSFNRRLATIDDIKASEILHINSGDGNIKTVSVFDNVKSTSTRHKRSEFDKVEEVSIEKFMKDILPSCTSVEVFLTNQHEGNMVTLTTSSNKDSKPIFKWNNNYSWTFNGNLAGKSQIKENVKAVGGKITGVLRSSLQWNDEDTKGIIDFDLHCITPFSEIFYGHKIDRYTDGWLDVDMINPTKVGIENITWQDRMKDGEYKFFVRNFSQHTKHNGFKAEIEFDGNTFNYQYADKFTKDIFIATVIVEKGIMTIKHHLPETNLSKEIYGLETNQFHKVNLICLSPNHWGENNVGNKHYIFMIDKCKAQSAIRSFHNENLIPDLLQHRKVMEVLGATNMIEPSENQLSGLGFNATVKDELIVKLSGNFKRVIKIKF